MMLTPSRTQGLCTHRLMARVPNPCPSSSSSTGLSPSNGLLRRPPHCRAERRGHRSQPWSRPRVSQERGCGGHGVPDTGRGLLWTWGGRGGVAGEAHGPVSRGTRVGQVEQTGDSFFPWRTDRPGLVPSSGGTQLSCLCCKPRCSRFPAQSS